MLFSLVILNYVALILLVVLLSSTIFRGMTKGITNYAFIFILFTVLAAVVFDIWAIHLDNLIGAHNLPHSRLLLCKGTALMHLGYLLSHNLTTPAYVVYIISLADIWHKVRGSKAQSLFLTVPYVLLVLMMIVNSFTGVIFTVDNGVYTREWLFPFLYAVAAYYMILALYYLYTNRKLFTAGKIAAITAMLPLTIIAVAIQYFFPDASVELFVNSLSLLFISMTTQRPEELIEPFTGLRNYNTYADDTKRAFANNKKIRIIMLNISNFHSLQAMTGYDSMKEMLRAIAGEIVKADKANKCRAELYHIDGGRFRMIINYRRRYRAITCAEELNRALDENMVFNELSLKLSKHICVVDCPEDIQDFKALTSFGSVFHEKVEDTGAVLYASEMFRNKQFDMVSSIDRIIDNALKKRNFKVFYQPIYSVEKGRFTSAEALLRLVDEDFGFVPPDLFIPAAEKSGAIHKIGDFVLDEVCRFIASDNFKALGLDYIEINLSVAQCMHGDLADKVLNTLKKYDITSDKINLEITETAVSYGQSIMKNNLDKLSMAGVSFSLDDYGTGYSNMRRVVQLPLKIVKLDKSFVDEQNNPKMWIMIQNTVRMLKDMDMEIVVEGIEDSETADQFASLDCDFIQGYYYSRPIPEDEFVDFIRKANA